MIELQRAKWKVQHAVSELATEAEVAQVAAFVLNQTDASGDVLAEFLGALSDTTRSELIARCEEYGR